MTRTMRWMATAATLAFASAGGGCAAGGWEDVLGGGVARNSYDVSGSVNRVDTRNRTLEIREERGRTVQVRYDGNTRMTYQGRRYQPSALERGDRVTLRVERDRRGDLYARDVVVRRDDGRYGGDDRATPGGRQTLEGRVGRVQRNEGRFELRTGQRTVWVALPYRPHNSVQDRFRRLRQGEQVRVQGVWLNQQRFEVERFR